MFKTGKGMVCQSYINIYIIINNRLFLNSYYKNKLQFMYSVDIGPINGGGQCWVNVINSGPALDLLCHALLATRVFLVQKE